jgi:ADP-ribosylglycohydrolase
VDDENYIDIVQVEKGTQTDETFMALLKIENLTKNRHVKIVNLYNNFFSSEITGPI